MTRQRTIWTAVPQTHARHACKRVQHEGIAVLCVRLSGYADNRSVSRITDALDAMACSLDNLPDVATLDVTGFANAPGDECATLTGVFRGLPCCWISHAWDQQQGRSRWDLPPAGQMAATLDLALDRVATWRRADGFTLAVDDADSTRTWKWSARGLHVTSRYRGALETEDLWHQNYLVERVLPRANSVHIFWPVPDRTGRTSEAMHRQARLVVTAGCVTEADYSEWSTHRPIPLDWVDRIADLTSLEVLMLRGAAASETDILRAVRTFPALHTLELPPGALRPETYAQLRREHPTLQLR